ncbi:MAG: hypothetical protein AAFQ63_18130 [Cyanobacteria bacterium J06621_11]
MPSARSNKKPAATEDSSPAQVVEAPQESAAASEENGALDAEPTGEQRKQKKRRKRKLPPPHQRRMVQALGRVEGCLSPVDGGIELVTADGAAFRVSSIGKSRLALRLLGLSDGERCGKFSFYPAFYKDGITVASFINDDDWQPHEDSPPVDQMFVCGTLQDIEAEGFSVFVGYEFKKRGDRVRRVLTVESAPLPEWAEGRWVDLILHRQGEEWRWQGEFHPRGPKVGKGFNSWLPYEEEAAVSEPQAQDELTVT